MSKYIFACKSLSSTIQQSELVKLGILPKEVSQYTVADIGSIISIPYTDESGKILLNNGCIEFEVVGVNHHKDINDESKPTITLMSKKILRCAAFDGIEPSNPLYDEAWMKYARAMYGNNRWSISNIRQWLNSEGAANEWFTPQHEYDTAPTANRVHNEQSGIYADDPGFLTGFSAEIKQHFATINNKTILCNLDKSTLSKDYEETEDKVFLPSYTEMGFGNLDNNPEGNHLDKMFKDDNSRIKSGGNSWYWMRGPNPDVTSHLYYINVYGNYDNAEYGMACDARGGVAPLIVLC